MPIVKVAGEMVLLAEMHSLINRGVKHATSMQDYDHSDEMLSHSSMKHRTLSTRQVLAAHSWRLPTQPPIVKVYRRLASMEAEGTLIHVHTISGSSLFVLSNLSVLKFSMYELSQETKHTNVLGDYAENKYIAYSSTFKFLLRPYLPTRLKHLSLMIDIIFHM